MVQQHDENERANNRGMLLDESATPAPYSLVTPDETPPSDASVDTQFATSEDRQHGETAPRDLQLNRLGEEPVAIAERRPG